MALLLLASGALHAQQYNDPGILNSPILYTPQDYEGRYFRVGSFTLRPSLDLVAEHHDNIFYENEGSTSDTVFHIRPKLEFNSGWSRHALSLGASADVARYRDNSTEDTEDVVFNLNARIDVKTGKYFTIQAATAQMHENRFSPEDLDGITPTEYDNNSLGIGYHHRFNRLTASLTYRTSDTSYDNNARADGTTIDNTDRDRGRDYYGLRLDYMIMPQRSVFLEFGRNRVPYDRLTDEAGFQRDSDGSSIRGGMSFDISGVLSGDVWLQHLDQSYDDPRFEDSNDIGFGMGLEWSPTRLTRISLQGSSTLLETTQEFSSGYVSNIYSARLQHEFRRWLLFHAGASFTRNDYELASGASPDALADTRSRRADVGLSYLFNRHVNMTAGYSVEKQTANRTLDEFDARRVFLILGVQF